MVRAIAVLLAVLAFPAAAQAAQPITLINDAGIPARQVAAVQWALQGQVNRQLAPAWQTPHITFAPGGWPLILAKGPEFHGLMIADQACLGPLPAGCHWQMSDGTPIAAIWVWRSQPPAWSVLASHELLEMLVDPSGWGTEICDPVENVFYPYRQEYVSAFITPTGGVVDRWRR